MYSYTLTLKLYMYMFCYYEWRSAVSEVSVVHVHMYNCIFYTQQDYSHKFTIKYSVITRTYMYMYITSHF